MARKRVPGVFCIEGPWSSSLKDRTSVKPVLKFLKDYGKADYIHRDANTPEELEHFLLKWPQRQYERFPIGMLGFHGSPGRLHIGRKSVALTEVGELLAGRLAGKTLYFASCAVLNLPKRDVQAFLRQTKAKTVLGYTQFVEWYDSVAFEIALMGALTEFKRSDAVERFLKKNYGALVKRLGFKVFYQSG